MRCLLLTLDCLPRRWMGCYGSLDSTTRGFDRLAAVGTIFENAISSDVRTEATRIAGFEVKQTADDRTQLLAAGRPVMVPSFVHVSQDQQGAKSKGRRRAESHLAQELHQASAWMREQTGSSFAWVRHRGVQLSSETMSQDDVGLFLEQQAILDGEIESFLDEWLDCADERSTFILTSSRGVLRSRTTQRRRADSPPAISDDLARVPLLILEGRGRDFGRRCLDLLPTTAIAAAITNDQSIRDPLSERLRGLDPTRFVTIQGKDGALAVRTADWLFVRSNEPDRESGEGLLFRKPEDVGDVFDMRSVQADEAIRLDALIGA